MKEKLTRNIGLKVLSIILAAILWLIITNVDDPVVPASFSNVPVKILNEDAILSQEMVYEIVEGAAIDFTVAVRRSIKETLTSSDFEVTADFAKLSDVNAVAIEIRSPKYGADVTVTEGRYQMMKINREERISKKFKVAVVTKGEPADGYHVGGKSVSNLITVSGPKSMIERIKDVVTEVNVSGSSETFTAYEKPKAYDEDGEEVVGKNLTFGQSYISVKITIYETKEIALTINPVGEPAYGYTVTKVEYEPRTIEIAGPEHLLRGMEELVINEDISEMGKSVQKDINIQEELEDGLQLVEDDHMAFIDITIERADTKVITFWPGDIEIRNLPPDLYGSFLTTGSLNLKVMGPADELKDISRSSLKLYVDLKDYTPGTYSVKVQADLEGYSKLASSPDVNVYIAPEVSGD